MAEESTWKDGMEEVVADLLQRLRCGELKGWNGWAGVQCRKPFKLNGIVLLCSRLTDHHENHLCESSSFKIEWWD